MFSSYVFKLKIKLFIILCIIPFFIFHHIKLLITNLSINLFIKFIKQKTNCLHLYYPYITLYPPHYIFLSFLLFNITI